jgi:hypothetical protein
MAIRCSAPFLWLVVSACASEPKAAPEHNRIQKEVAADVARICALTAGERQAEIERIRSNDGVAIVCPPM